MKTIRYLLLLALALCFSFPLKAADARKDITPAIAAQQPTPPMVTTSAATPLAGEQIKWQVISGGGNRGTSPSFILTGTVGQTAAGPVTSTSFKLNQGFWQNFSPASCCVGVTGNVNAVGIVDLSDLSALVSYLTGGGYVLPCVPETNVNNVGIVDLSDLSALVSYLTGGGYVLPACS